MNQRVLIVEDEALIADHLAAELTDLLYEISGIVDSADQVFDHLSTHEVELVLLDIHLGGHMDGVDIANVINSKFNSAIVFVTSNSDSRTLERVKHTEPAGFITKPFKREQLESTLALAIGSVKKQNKHHEDAFFLKEKHALIKVNYQDVLYAEANDNYCFLYTKDSRFLLSQTLKSVELKLSSSGFARCHRSYVVNLIAINKIEPRAIFIGDNEIPLSESYRSSILDRVNLF